MNTQSNEETRPLYWSVRRELWENRSITIAPLAVAAVFLFGFMISTIGMPSRRQALLLTNIEHQRAVIEQPYDAAAIMLMITALIVGVFYCLDALHGDRRDRSILFWKSLPVSDRTTVLSKASIPLAVLPLLTFAVIVTTQLAMLLWTSLVLLPSGLSGTTWTRFNLLEQSVILLYGLIALVLWHAPLYGWLLLVSGWARRATFLWAFLPPLLIAGFEKIAIRTSYFGEMLKYRVMGHVSRAFIAAKDGRISSLSQLTPGRYLSTPGLWVGLIFAAIFLAAAVRMRRDRGELS
jgi:ABC-2 type transport system permease protein